MYDGECHTHLAARVCEHTFSCAACHLEGTVYPLNNKDKKGDLFGRFFEFA